ncbi:MAG: serine/threonine protein kinase [Planctomycetes bacterium]|nr:serine/threonine protein kinase [Planctomycetota bacterium]
MQTIGQYKILGQLGRGGFGRTYLAEHSHLGSRVVIKRSLFKEPELRALLLEEARLLYEVRHWALPHVKDVIVLEDGDVLVVMSYIPGQDLMRWTEEHGRADPETCAWIAQRVLSGLHYLHFHGIVHCDVKPANIVVDWEEHSAVLVDFGLARRPDAEPEPLGLTPAFGAPEQHAGMPAIPEMDVYGLGMTLLHLLGGDLGTRKVPPEVPAELRDFVSKMVLVDPRRRPRDCDALNLELSEIRRRAFGRASTRA